MLAPLAYGLAVVLSLFVAFIGARFLLAPQAAARRAFTTADAVARFMLIVALNPLGDTVVVLRNGGTKAVAFGIHFATALVVLLDAALLFAL